MIIRHVQKSDKEFWFKLDKHLSENELDNKIRDKGLCFTGKQYTYCYIEI